MEKDKKRALLAFLIRIVGFAVGVAGIVYHLMLNKMLDTGFMVKHNLAYFTLQTNIFTTIIFGVLIVKTIVILIKSHRLEIAQINHSWYLACTVYITITMLVYWLILTPLIGQPKNSILLIDSILLHTVTPFFAIIDYVFFFKHGVVKKNSVFKWLIYPVCYWISVVIIAQFIKEPYYIYKFGDDIVELMYPYPFLDPNVVGISGVGGIVCLMIILFLLFSSLYIQIDKKLEKIVK